MQITPIRTILIDDEPDSKAVLEIMLNESCKNVEIIAKCSSANEAIEQIQLLKPDLILLDIEMPGKDGFAVLKAFENPKFKVVFITGYEQYALKAIKFSAIDYVLKPIDIAELKVSIMKVEESLKMEDNRIAHFNSVFENREKAVEKLIIPTLKGFHTIELDKIESIEAQSGNYCLFKLSDQKLDLVTKPLNYFEELLPKERFFRVHRSHIVNLGKVSSYNNKSGEIKMDNGDELEVAVRRRADFRKGIKYSNRVNRTLV